MLIIKTHLTHWKNAKVENMKALMVAVLLSLFSYSAFAEQVEISWDAVTQREDGTNTVGVISYRIFYNNELLEETSQLSLTAEVDQVRGQIFCASAVETIMDERVEGDQICVVVRHAPAHPGKLRVKIN